jgi:hypothetical protein
MSVPQQAALHGLLRHAVVSYKVSQEKIMNLQWLHRSLMNTLKRKCPRTEPCSTLEVTIYGKERVSET